MIDDEKKEEKIRKEKIAEKRAKKKPVSFNISL